MMADSQSVDMVVLPVFRSLTFTARRRRIIMFNIIMARLTIMLLILTGGLR